MLIINSACGHQLVQTGGCLGNGTAPKLVQHSLFGSTVCLAVQSIWQYGLAVQSVWHYGLAVQSVLQYSLSAQYGLAVQSV